MDIALVFSALVLVVCLMVGLAWFMQKSGLADGNNFLNKYKPKNLKIIEQLPLDPKRRILLIQAGKKNYLILTGGQNDLLLDGNVTLPKTDKEETR